MAEVELTFNYSATERYAWETDHKIDAILESFEDAGWLKIEATGGGAFLQLDMDDPESAEWWAIVIGEEESIEELRRQIKEATGHEAKVA